MSLHLFEGAFFCKRKIFSTLGKKGSEGHCADGLPFLDIGDFKPFKHGRFTKFSDFFPSYFHRPCRIWMTLMRRFDDIIDQPQCIG